MILPTTRVLVRFVTLAGACLALSAGAVQISTAGSLRLNAGRGREDDLFSRRDSLFKRGSREYREVALTFDDGPHPGSLAQILDTLHRYNIHATFFVVGEKVRQYPELCKRILSEGHEVGNHTENHERLDTLPIRKVEQELEDCAEEVRRATGFEMTLMRPPGMRYTDPVLQTAKRMGYTTVSWNVGAHDFVHLPPALIAERVIGHVENGSIILLHDCPDTAAALPAILDSLLKTGYLVKNISEMLAELPHPIRVVANPLSRTRPWDGFPSLQARRLGGGRPRALKFHRN